MAPEVLATLHATPSQEIIQATDTNTSIFTKGLFSVLFFYGRVFPGNSMTACPGNRQNHVQLITDSTLNEGIFYLGDPEVLTLVLYQKFWQAWFGAHASKTPWLCPVSPATGDADVAGAIDRKEARGKA